MLDSLDASDAERRHVFGGLQRFMSWCAKRGLAAANPCDDLERDERPKPGKARDNAPDIDTLRKVWRAVESEAPSLRDLTRFLLLTPLRRDEAAGLRWSEIDLVRSWIKIDGARMKNGEPHELPLSKPAFEILMARSAISKPAAEQLVFPTPEAGAALNSWTRLTTRVRRAIGHDALPADRQFRWHDIRRSFVTHLAEEFDEAALDAMLAHRRKGVAGVYQKQKYLNRRPAVMARWAEMLARSRQAQSRPPTSSRFAPPQSADMISSCGRPDGHPSARTGTSLVPCRPPPASFHDQPGPAVSMNRFEQARAHGRYWREVIAAGGHGLWQGEPKTEREHVFFDAVTHAAEAEDRETVLARVLLEAVRQGRSSSSPRKQTKQPSQGTDPARRARTRSGSSSCVHSSPNTTATKPAPERNTSTPCPRRTRTGRTRWAWSAVSTPGKPGTTCIRNSTRLTTEKRRRNRNNNFADFPAMFLLEPGKSS